MRFKYRVDYLLIACIFIVLYLLHAAICFCRPLHYVYELILSLLLLFI